MSLKAFVKSLDEVAEAFRQLYTKSEDGFVLALDDKDYKEKLDEFRSNNTALTKKMTDASKTLDKYKGIDPEEYARLKALADTLDKSDDSELVKAGKIDEVIKKRTAAMQDDYTKQLRLKDAALTEATGRVSKLTTKLEEVTVANAIRNTLEQVGRVRPGAMPDIEHRAKATWRLDEAGELIPKTSSGETIFGKKGEPLTLEEWAAGLVTSAPHLFEPGTGGGAGGGRKGDASTGVKVIGDDPVEFGKNLDDIAKGKTIVRTQGG